MKYTKEERLEIGRQIYDNEINKNEAAEKYEISPPCARDYMRLYRDFNHLPPKNQTRTFEGTGRIIVPTSTSGMEEYESMSKEELIKELVKARINEERLKKGYEVKGVGSEKVFVPLDSKNTK